MTIAIAENQESAIKYYTGFGFLSIDRWFCSDETVRNLDEELKTAGKHKDSLMELMRPLKEGIKLYRYCNFDFLPCDVFDVNRDKTAEELINKYWYFIKDNPFQNSSFTSFCRKALKAKKGDAKKENEIVWEVTVNKGVNGADISKFSNKRHEEILLPQETFFTINDYKKRDGKIILEMSASGELQEGGEILEIDNQSNKSF